MNLQSSFIRCFPAFSLILFLLLHHIIYPDFLNFQLSVSLYSLCFFVLLTESLFLFFYKERAYPQAVDLGLLFLSALFLSSLFVVIKAPLAFFFVFLFIFIQALSWIFLKKIFQTTVFFIYLSFLLPLFLSASSLQILEQKSSLIPFSLLILTLMFVYLLSFYFIFDLLNKKNKQGFSFNEDQYFFLTLSSDFSRKLKPFLNQALKHSSVFEEDIKKTEKLLKHNETKQLSFDFLSAKKIKKDLDSLNNFILRFIEYIELFSEKLGTKFISLNAILNDSLKELEKHPKKPKSFDLKESLKFKKDFELKASGEHLKKAFKNIIINAFEAHNSSVSNSHFNIHSSSYGDWLVIHFIDEGQGISAEEEKRVFTPFYSKKFGLGGLGLAYAKKVIELHQGTIEIKREDEKTKVIVRLPLIKFRNTSPHLKKKAIKRKTA